MDKNDQALWVNKLWEPLEKIEESPLHSKKDGIKVAAYCRLSADVPEISQSLENQLSHYTHVINDRENWTFVGIYFDNLVTGRKASLRRGFTRMLRHCEEGKIDLILVKNVSRFSRNTKELIEVIERLKEINVTVYFETENIESTRSDTAYLLKTYASIAQGEIEASSASIEWGHEQRILKGKTYLGPIYGYTQEKAGDEIIITINEEQAEVVRSIYQMYLSGMSQNSIAAELTNQDVKTYFGKTRWSRKTISSILSNVSYTGDVLTRKRTRDLMSNKIRSSEGVRDQYLIENHHPTIISKEIYELANSRRKKNVKKKKTTSPSCGPNPLSKRVLCGNCKSSFLRTRYSPWSYFKCVTSTLKNELCPTPTIRDDYMISLMLRGVEERFKIEELRSIKMLQRMLVRINQNDHFEFHRLKALTQIQLAKSLRGIQYSDEMIERMEKDYHRFEKRLAEIEDDRQYRLDAIQWLDKVNSYQEFKDQATIELLRAWILEMVIYSKEDYQITWVDGEETIIGDCLASAPEVEVPKRKYYLRKSPEIEVLEPSRITSAEGGDETQEEEFEVLAERKLESDMVVKKIKKQLSSSVLMQTSIPAVREDKLKVAAYVRVSTELEHQKTSIKTQYSYYLFLILKDPRYTLAGIYMDDGKSGRTTDDRPEFKRMIDDCRSGKIDLIVTKSISRFARNTVDTLSYLNILKGLDPPVEVWFERENLRSLDSKSNVLISLLSALGQEESVSLGEAISWGRRSLAQRGIARPARLGYGYQYGKNKEWKIKEEEAEVVKRIYRAYEKGVTVSEICRVLTDDSIPTPGGKKRWSHTTVRSILRSEIYRGNYIYQRFHNGFSLEKKRIRNTGELPMYYIENHHEGIIDDQQWLRVQKRIENNEKKRKENYEEFPDDQGKNESFARKFYCGKCGSLVGYSRAINRTKNNRETRWWRCYRSGKGLCDSMHLNQEYLEENFSQLLMDLKFNPAFDEYIESFIEGLEITSEDDHQRERLLKETEELNQELYQAVEGELSSKERDTRLIDELTDEIMAKRQVLISYTEREEQIEDVKEEVNALKKALDTYKNKGRDNLGYYKNAPQFSPELFDRFIADGTILDNGRILYRFKSCFEWSAPIKYEDYQERNKRKRRAMSALEKKEFLKGPEVERLLSYCKEPKSIVEMREFLPRYLTNYNFKKYIVNPLMEKGLLKETIPDKPTSRLQKYYSIKD